MKLNRNIYFEFYGLHQFNFDSKILKALLETEQHNRHWLLTICTLSKMFVILGDVSYTIKAKPLKTLIKQKETSLTIDKDIAEKLTPWYELYTHFFIQVARI